MLLHKTVVHDGRVRREARALAEGGHEVVVVHLPRDPASVPDLDEPFSLEAATVPRARRIPSWLRRGLEALNMARLARGGRPDVVHAHDAAMLLPGYVASRLTGARLVYDSHELATAVPYRSGVWAMLVATIERLIVPRCAAVITVSNGIAQRIQERYRLRRQPTVVRNIPDLRADGAAPDLRATLGVEVAPLVLHQGAVAALRGCETLVCAMDELPDAHLVFVGAEGAYARKLEHLARGEGLAARVHFVELVPLESLLAFTRQADVGVSLLEGDVENHRLALPNKVFEYLRAGIPVVVRADSEVSVLVDGLGVGVGADPSSPRSVANALERVLALRGDAGLRSRLVSAREELTWDQEKEALVGLYAEPRLSASTSR